MNRGPPVRPGGQQGEMLILQNDVLVLKGEVPILQIDVFVLQGEMLILQLVQQGEGVGHCAWNSGTQRALMLGRAEQSIKHDGDQVRMDDCFQGRVESSSDDIEDRFRSVRTLLEAAARVNEETRKVNEETRKIIEETRALGDRLHKDIEDLHARSIEFEEACAGDPPYTESDSDPEESGDLGP